MIDLAQRNKASLQEQIARPDYAEKVPADVQGTNQTRLRELDGEMESLRTSVRNFEELLRGE